MGMDEHCVCHLLKFSDLPLCNAILVVCCNSSKGEALSLLLAQLSPSNGGEAPIVHMIVLDSDPMLLTKSFECDLAFHGVFQVNGLLKPDKSQASCLVDIDSGMAILFHVGLPNIWVTSPGVVRSSCQQRFTLPAEQLGGVPPSLCLRSWTSMVSWCSSLRNMLGNLGFYR